MQLACGTHHSKRAVSFPHGLLGRHPLEGGPHLFNDGEAFPPLSVEIVRWLPPTHVRVSSPGGRTPDLSDMRLV